MTVHVISRIMPAMDAGADLVGSLRAGTGRRRRRSARRSAAKRRRRSPAGRNRAHRHDRPSWRRFRGRTGSRSACQIHDAGASVLRRSVLGARARALRCRRPLRRAAVPLPAHHDENERAEREHGRGAGDANRAHDHEAVASRRRVVVIAVQQQRDRRAIRLARPRPRRARSAGRAGRIRCRRDSARDGPRASARSTPVGCANCRVCSSQT